MRGHGPQLRRGEQGSGCQVPVLHCEARESGPHTQSFPASKTSIQDEKFATDVLKPFAEQLNNSRPEPAFARWSEMEPIIYEYMQYAVSGSMTVEKACEGMTKDINSLLQS